MTETNDVHRRRLLSGICLVGLAIFFLSNPFTRVLVRGGTAESLPAIAMTGFLAPVHVVCMIGSIFAITQLLRRRADRIGLAGAAMVLLGWTVGSRIMVLGQLEALLKNGATGVPSDTLQKMFQAAPLIWASIVPSGLLFPLGLITLGITIFLVKPIPRWIGLLLIAGGVCFPIGRIGNVLWAVVSSDLLLGTAFALIGWSVFTREEVLPS
jgi:hypothetical protein